jgi:hypothetical protein
MTKDQFCLNIYSEVFCDFIDGNVSKRETKWNLGPAISSDLLSF